MNAPLIVKNLEKIYARGKGSGPASELKAVDGVSFLVRAGECLGLLGPNGAGKSTTMKCVTGFFSPTRGEVEILGHNVHLSPRAARQLLGVCSQDDTLDTDFTVIDQLIQFASFFAIPESIARPRAETLLRRFDLIDKAKDLVESLSGGMRRRLQVARALINEPKLLILDEPTTGLDPEARRSLWTILEEERQKGLAVLLSTHYMAEAERLCDRVAIIHKGRILAEDTPRALITNHIGTAEQKEEIRPGVIFSRPANLEDVYLKLTGSSLDGGEET